MRPRAPLAFLLTVLLLLAVPGAWAEEEDPQRPRRGGERGGSMWERIQRYDADGDGRVSREEFEGPERFFERLDADGDGYVTKAEADQVKGRRGGSQRRSPGSAAVPTGITFTMIDADGDGIVSLAEWVAFYAGADADADGRVTKEEWANVVKPPTRPGGQAPGVGTKAPDVNALPLEGGEAIDLGSPRRTTVLVFGSWT